MDIDELLRCLRWTPEPLVVTIPVPGSETVVSSDSSALKQGKEEEKPNAESPSISPSQPSLSPAEGDPGSEPGQEDKEERKKKERQRVIREVRRENRKNMRMVLEGTRKVDEVPLSLSPLV